MESQLPLWPVKVIPSDSVKLIIALTEDADSNDDGSWKMKLAQRKTNNNRIEIEKIRLTVG